MRDHDSVAAMATRLARGARPARPRRPRSRCATATHPITSPTSGRPRPGRPRWSLFMHGGFWRRSTTGHTWPLATPWPRRVRRDHPEYAGPARRAAAGRPRSTTSGAVTRVPPLVARRARPPDARRGARRPLGRRSPGAVGRGGAGPGGPRRRAAWWRWRRWPICGRRTPLDLDRGAVAALLGGGPDDVASGTPAPTLSRCSRWAHQDRGAARHRDDRRCRSNSPGGSWRRPGGRRRRALCGVGRRRPLRADRSGVVRVAGRHRRVAHGYRY